MVQWGIGLAVDLFISFGHARDAALTRAFLCLAALQAASLLWYVLRRPSSSSIQVN